MDKMNKILYLVLVFFLGGLGIHKFISGRIVPGVVQLVLSFLFGIGALIALVEFFYVIFAVHRPEGSSDIDIPKGFFDFLKA